MLFTFQNNREVRLGLTHQRRKGGFPQFMLIFLCALAALREIFFLKKDMDRLRSEFGDSNVIGHFPSSTEIATGANRGKVH